jgi:hypothetical protein
LVQAEQVAELAFAGTKKQQELARRLHRVFLIQGRFFAEHAPIRIPVTTLAEFMESQEPGHADWAAEIDAALSASAGIFTREEREDQIVFVTTRGGTPPSGQGEGPNPHLLTRRFATPEPKRETAVIRRQRLIIPDIVDIEEPQPAYEPDSWQAAVAESLRAAEEAAARLDIEQVEAEAAELDIELAEPTVVAPSVAADTIDAATASDEELADAIRTTLGRELTVARWGDVWMAEDRVARFSRGDLRRIEDFLREQGDAAGDAEIVQDVLGVRSNAPAFETTRFALNYRLSRETREFEYLGTDTTGFWALANLPSVGTVKRKASEIGQDYRFLLDYRTPPEQIEEGLVEHVLTFYEYAYGVLPLDANIATIMPRQGFPDQRAARITFESPQTLETVVAELRFPTSNRGGFIAGLERFFAANLVPGAAITIERTDQPTHFLLEYFQVSGDDRKLLHLDERKGRYVFRSTTYYCATQDDMLLTEGRFPKLADAKPLDERVRRRPEQVVAMAFERVGENVGTASEPRYWAVFSDLLSVVNVERPISAEFLRDILTSGTYQEFTSDDTTEDAFFYQPPAGS